MSSAAVTLKPGALRITIQNGAKRGQTLSFNGPTVTIGRGPENDIVLSDDVKVSRQHVQIEFTAVQTVIKNVSSKNSLLIDGLEQTNYWLQAPVEIQVGETKILISPPQQQLASPPPLQHQPLRVAGLSPLPPPPPSLPGKGKSKIRLSKPMSAPGSSSAGSFRFLLILVLVGAVGIWLFTDDAKSKKSGAVAVRTDDVAVMDLQKSESMMRELEKKQEERGQQSVQYKMAQENYIKGFRDYRQGQYGRAMNSFQAALSFYPQHQLASKYYTLSKRKFDEKVQVHMLQGQRYRGKNNYRLCKSSFASVMIMVRDPNDAIYKEAKQYYNECSLLMEGRF